VSYCPKCGVRVAKMANFCRECGFNLEAEETQLEDSEKSQSGESTPEAKCANHPERDAVDTCVECGMGICAYCKTTLENKLYCPSCVDKMLGKPKEKTDTSNQGVLASVFNGAQEQETAELITEHEREIEVTRKKSVETREGKNNIFTENDTGETMFEIKTLRICSNGILLKQFRKQELMRWEAIDRIFISGKKEVFLGLITFSDTFGITFVDWEGRRIGTSTTWNSWNPKSGERILAIYNYIVGQVSERQWAQLLTHLKSGQTVSFFSFDIAPDGIYRKKALKGYTKLELSRVYGYNLHEGKLLITYEETDGSTRAHGLGSVESIPNIHIAQRFIDAIADTNIGRCG